LEFKDVVKKRRSIRKFLNADIPKEALVNILEAGHWAPSAGNCQPWHFVVVTDPQIKTTIAQICTKYSRKHWMRFSPERAKYLAARGGSWDKSCMKDIPILIVVGYKFSENVRDELILGSVWMAVENMLLAAADEGLGSCVYTFLNRREESEIRRILRGRQEDRIVCMIQLGYKKSESIPPSRKKMGEIVSYDRF
jgi:nitroreductase